MNMNFFNRHILLHSIFVFLDQCANKLSVYFMYHI
jgi:hypothetical protein